jgi:hypothetical protein
MANPINTALTPVSFQNNNSGGNSSAPKKPDDATGSETDNQDAENTTINETPEERQARLQLKMAEINTKAQMSMAQTQANAQAFQAGMGALSLCLGALASGSGGGSGGGSGASAGASPKFGNSDLQEQNQNRGQNFFSSLDSNKINNIQQNLSKLPPDLARDINQFMNSKDSSSYNDINHRLSQFRNSDGEKLSLEKLAEENIEPVKQTEEIESISFPEE